LADDHAGGRVATPVATPPPFAGAIMPETANPTTTVRALLGDAEFQQRQQRSRNGSAIFGSITRVLADSINHQSLPLSEVRWLVLPAVATGQYAVAEGPLDQRQPDGAFGPIAVVAWGLLSPEIDQQLTQNPDVPLRLTIPQWQSGTIPWILETAGSKPVVDRIIADLLAKQFKGAPVKIRVRSKDGKTAIEQFAASA
jgi:hemolysin-activating ACP:hemolysin acyltransferase